MMKIWTPVLFGEFIPASRAGVVTFFCLFMAYRACLRGLTSVRIRCPDEVLACHIHSPLFVCLKISKIAEVTGYNFRITVWNPDRVRGPFKKIKKNLLVLRRLHFLREPALEVLLDLAVILPEVVVHRGVDFLLGRIEVAAGYDCCSLAEGKHAGLTAECFEVRANETICF